MRLVLFSIYSPENDPSLRDLSLRQRHERDLNYAIAFQKYKGYTYIFSYY